MPIRKPMADNSVFHIFNKSIAGFNIFHGEKDFDRFVCMTQYSLLQNAPSSFSNFLRNHGDRSREKIATLARQENYSSPLRLIAYCLMPTHFHLVLYQKHFNDISLFMHKLESSYTQFFNMRHKRKGPLWESRFKHVECKTDGQLLHLTRYVHLNPVTAYLIDKPEDWAASSYLEYVDPEHSGGICSFGNAIQINPETYKKFVNDRIEDQRTLAEIKDLLLD